MGRRGMKSLKMRVDQESSISRRGQMSPLLFAIVVEVITENARRSVLNELLCTHDLVLTSKTMED